MTQEVITRIKLTASKGYTLTNGVAFGKEIFLGESDSAENWREITDEDAEKLQKEQVEVNE